MSRFNTVIIHAVITTTERVITTTTVLAIIIIGGITIIDSWSLDPASETALGLLFSREDLCRSLTDPYRLE